MNNLIVKEYLGNNIEFKIIKGEVYANATSMCKVFGKEIRRWNALDSTKNYIKALTEKVSTELVIVNQGGVEQGTWIHERLVIKLAEWLDINFEIWCDEQIATLIRNGRVEIIKRTEEDMLMELFPSSDSNLIQLTAQNIRQVKSLTKELTHKEDVIIGLVDDIDLTTKRQRITQIVRHGSKNNHQERYNMLYKEFSMKYHCDLNRRMESYNENNKPKVRNKMDYIDKVMNKIPELYEIACKIFENDIEKLKKEWDSTIKGAVI